MPRMSLEELRKSLPPERFKELYDRYRREIERGAAEASFPQRLEDAEVRARKTKLEVENQAFKIAVLRLGVGPVLREHRFHPTRRWRFDYALTDYKVAIEIEGGIFGRDRQKPCPTCHQTLKGRHNTIVGMLNDMDKYNTATALGWRVLRFTREQMKMPLLNATLAIIELTVRFEQRTQ